LGRDLKSENIKGAIALFPGATRRTPTVGRTCWSAHSAKNDCGDRPACVAALACFQSRLRRSAALPAFGAGAKLRPAFLFGGNTPAFYSPPMRHGTFVLRTFLLAALAGLVLCGCSAFNYEWRQAAKKSTPVNEITGRWEGRWISTVNGHNDMLRALISKVDSNHYDVKFHAAYKSETIKWITVHFGYTVHMETKPATNGIVEFHGSENLGVLAGGVYTYDGRADPTSFFSTYKSKYDRGTFEMKRPNE
jgi:hypothetical protein